ncbi:uncharacterized protein FA14DRAFT_154910 [Meira miltonrushii]|uniref:Uncharacterized protein n=1 Tax=Meira miltonrushii TaxID=1280837 RepID=A0A316VD73_9BASI|nr:uncharacterized protein FA14DRAFT_154910 [Meira miltonrushii]PWN35496.1 hypothetical protein FA14DRAFT_154910 [Meira miltonrushii]
MSSFPILFKALKVIFFIGTLAQVAQCAGSSSSKSTTPSLVRGQDDPNQMYHNPNEVSDHLKDQAYHHRWEKHQLFEKDLKHLGASESELEHGTKMRKLHTNAMKDAEMKSKKVLKVSKQLASSQHSNFGDRNLQRLRPNPASKIQKKKPVSNEVRKLTS